MLRHIQLRIAPQPKPAIILEVRQRLFDDAVQLVCCHHRKLHMVTRLSFSVAIIIKNASETTVNLMSYLLSL